MPVWERLRCSVLSEKDTCQILHTCAINVSCCAKKCAAVCCVHKHCTVYTLAPPRMTFIPLTAALAAKLFFDLAVRLQCCFAPKIYGAGSFGHVCNPLSPRPDIGRAMSISRQRWHVVPAEGPRLLQVTAVGTVLGGTSSLHPPLPHLARPRR